MIHVASRVADAYWAVWIVVLFGLPEFYFLGTGQPQDTLSETTWRWFDVVPGQTVWEWSIAHLLLAVFLTWLWLHMVLGIFRVWGAHL